MIFLVQGWADFVDWLGGGPAAQAPAASVTLVVTAALAVFTFLYAKSAGRQAKASVRMAEAARDQAEASARIAEATLCPAIEQWVERTSLHGAAIRRVEVKYANTGAGPAVNIWWGLYSKDGRFLHSRHHRIGMGTREKQDKERKEDQVGFDLDVSAVQSGLLVKAEYESVLGALWRSSLSLVVEAVEGNSYLVNGEPSFERIAQRTIQEPDK